MRSQCRVDESALVGLAIALSKTIMELIPFLSIGSASCAQDRLLFITSLNFFKEIFHFSILFYVEINAIEQQGPLRYQLICCCAVDLLIGGIGEFGSLIFRVSLNSR